MGVGGGRDEWGEGRWGCRGGAGVEAGAVVVGRHWLGEGSREGPFADEADAVGSVAEVLESSCKMCASAEGSPTEGGERVEYVGGWGAGRRFSGVGGREWCYGGGCKHGKESQEG